MKLINYFLILSLLTGLSWAQVSFNGSYTQDFNTLANSDSSNVLPSGWALYETGSYANTYYSANDGGNNKGDTYSFGASGSSERAFGGLQSSSLVPRIGAGFTNNTGTTLTSITITYTGEYWRCGTAGRLDTIKLQLSTDATSLNSGTWIYYPNLFFITPSDTFSTGAKNGNSSPYRTNISYTISGLNIANGANFWIRWIDANASGADDGMAVDDFSMTVPSVPSLSVNPSSLNFDTLLLNDTLQLSYQLVGNNLTNDVNVSAPAYFKISRTSGSGYKDTLIFAPSGGQVSATIYVLFLPVTNEGSYSGNITHTSTGAAPQNVAVSGYGTKIKLFNPLSSFGAVVVGQTSATKFYTYKASGLIPDEDFIIQAPTHYQISFDSTSGFTNYLSKLVPTSGRLPLDTVYVRFQPTTVGVKLDSISHSSTGAITRYRRVYGRAVDLEPTMPATNIQFSNVDSVKMTVSWSRGNGAACLVLARSEGPIANVPLDGFYYAAADSFGKGSSAGSGHYVVYKGTGSSVTVKKLYGITTYHFAVFEYNGPDSCENYLTASYPTASQITKSMSGKISLTNPGVPYNQDFNSLDTTTQYLPQGWNYREEGSQANYTYAANNGSSSSGNIYSYGLNDSTDRAFGCLLTSSLVPCLSAVFTNNTGGLLQAVDISYYGELWRLGLQRYDSLKFEISTSPGAWTSVPALLFITPDTTGAYGPRNGNLAANRSYLWASISGLNMANGSDFRIRWVDADAPSYDDGLAIDDFRLIPFNGVSLPRIVGTWPADSATGVARNAPVKIGFSEPINPSTLTYNCNPDPGGWSASWNAVGDTVTLTHNNFQYWTNYTFNVTGAKDLEGFNIISSNIPNPFRFKTTIDPNAPPMYITMLNVGQGDCMIIRSPTGKRILIDAGDGGDDIQVFNFIKDSIDIGTNSKYLDYTFLSHYHDDHGGGLDEVISRLDSLRVYACDRGDWHTAGNTTYSNYIDSLTAKGWISKRHAVTLGETFDIGGGATIKVICFNGKTLSGDSIVPAADDENNHSLGLLLNYADEFKMVMCGDIGKSVERLLSPDIGGRISVLKANHHGSNDASGLQWATDLDPMITLIPVGDGNSYGHVHVEARDSLLADPKPNKAAGDSNRLYRTELGSGAACVPGRDTAMYQNIHIEVTPGNPLYCFKVLNDGRTFPWLKGPLWAQLSSLVAMMNRDNSIIISWRTESEANIYQWEIERSEGAEGNYAPIGTLPGHGTTNQPHDYQFVDTEDLPAGTYWYRLCEVELDGKRHYYGPVSVDYQPGGRYEFALGAARPNPFNKITNIDFQITKAGKASLKIYNVLGQEVRTLSDGEHAAGRHRVTWDGRDRQGRRVSSGVYFYRLESGENVASGRLLFVR